MEVSHADFHVMQQFDVAKPGCKFCLKSSGLTRGQRAEVEIDRMSPVGKANQAQRRATFEVEDIRQRRRPGQGVQRTEHHILVLTLSHSHASLTGNTAQRSLH
jgi:hypothetical protein